MTVLATQRNAFDASEHIGRTGALRTAVITLDGMRSSRRAHLAGDPNIESSTQSMQAINEFLACRSSCMAPHIDLDHLSFVNALELFIQLAPARYCALDASSRRPHLTVLPAFPRLYVRSTREARAGQSRYEGRRPQRARVRLRGCKGYLVDVGLNASYQRDEEPPRLALLSSLSGLAVQRLSRDIHLFELNVCLAATVNDPPTNYTSYHRGTTCQRRAAKWPSAFHAQSRCSHFTFTSLCHDPPSCLLVHDQYSR